MKKIKLLFVFIIGMMVLQSYGQKLKVNEKDEMSGDFIKRTSSVYIQAGFVTSTSVYVEKINNITYLRIPFEKVAKTWLTNVENQFSVNKDQLVIIKLLNDSIVKLKIKYDVTATKGGNGKPLSGCPGFNITCEIPESDIQKLLLYSAIKMRIYINDPKIDKGYFEFDIEKNTIFKDLLTLIK